MIWARRKRRAGWTRTASPPDFVRTPKHSTKWLQEPDEWKRDEAKSLFKPRCGRSRCSRWRANYVRRIRRRGLSEQSDSSARAQGNKKHYRDQQQLRYARGRARLDVQKQSSQARHRVISRAARQSFSGPLRRERSDAGT